VTTLRNLCLSWVLAACLLVVIPLQAQQQIVDGVAAVVEDEIILLSDIQQYAQMQAMQMGVDPYQNPQKFQRIMQRIQPQVLQSLVNQKIIQAKAREDSVIIKDHQVEQALQQQIDNMSSQAGGIESLEQQLGMSISEIRNEYRDDIRKRLLVEQYQSTKFADISVSRREVEQFYKSYKDSIPPMPKRVNISHILLQVKPSKSADSLAVTQLRDIRQMLGQGASFDSLARKFSEDPGSSQRGGDLGFVSRGTLVPRFEETAFNLSEGELSDIIKTEFGYHLIKLVERRGEKIHVKHILRTPESTESDRQEVIRRLNRYRKLAEQGADFDSLAREHSEDTGVQLNSGNLGWYEIPNLRVPEFKQAVDTMDVGDISRPFQSDFGWHIIKLNDMQQGGEVTLDDNWVELEQMVRQQKRSQEYQRWLKNLRSQFYVEVKVDTSSTSL